jgi:acyl-coenzyme A synthetase/AMP-(fatty) acid ligase
VDEPARISRTSGSTGPSKFMLLLRQAQEQWIISGIDKAMFTAQTRLLITGPLVMNACLTRSSFCLRRGGTVLVGSGRRVPDWQPTHLWGLPLHIERLLSEVPADYVATQPVALSTLGGAMSPALRASAQRVFGGGRILNRYGSNEAGAICDDLDASGTGLISAGTDVRILGPDGADLPPGHEGIIAVRTPAMAEGYLGLPRETAEAFRDGWYVSGDVGTLLAARLLRLAGRHDDLVNIGGIKVAASVIEADLVAQPAIAQACVLAVHLDGGAVSLGISVVLAPGASTAEATEQVKAALRTNPDTSARLQFVEALPRLQNGKVDRMALLRSLSTP